MANLSFDAEKHEYRADGVVVPSVSNIISVLRDYSSIPLGVLEVKRKWGETAHLYLAMHDRGTLDPDRSKWDERMVPLVDAWQRFREQFGIVNSEFDQIERPYFHEIYRYAGTPDRVFASGRVVVDIKTADKPQPSTGVQLAAYAALVAVNDAAEGRDPNDLRLIECCLHESGTYKTKEYEFKPNWNIFMCCMTIHNFLGGK